MKKFILYIFFLNLFVFSCKREGIDYVRGTVVEEGTTIPIAGAKVYLSVNPYFGHNQDVIDSAVTDVNGQYKLNFSKIIASSYFIKCVCLNYTYGLTNPPIGKLKHGRTVQNFSFIPNAFIKFRYIKTVASDTSVMVMLNSKGDQDVVYGPRVSYSVAVQPFDITRREGVIFGNRWLTIDWRKYSITTFTGGNTNSYSWPNHDSFFVKKGDTLNYTITFN